jgi:DNA phosphorothioation-dependent restriction protein DptG
VIEPYQLGIHLHIEPHELGRIESNNREDIHKQKVEIINYWFDEMHPSWKALAEAVERTRRYRKLVKQLKQRHERLQDTSSTKPSES